MPHSWVGTAPHTCDRCETVMYSGLHAIHGEAIVVFFPGPKVKHPGQRTVVENGREVVRTVHPATEIEPDCID